MIKPLPVQTLRFPTLVFSQNSIVVEENEASLTSCAAGALKNGWFEKMTIIDSDLNCFEIVGAKKLHGMGRFWGYNIFLNQRIKVELLVAEDPIKVSISEVKEKVFESFKRRSGWSTRDDFEELKERIRNAEFHHEIIKALTANVPVA